LADRYLVGQAGAAFGGADADTAGGDAADVAFGDDTGDAVGDATFEAAGDETAADDAAVVGVAGGAADVDAPVVHPATLIPTAAAAATTAKRLMDLGEPSIANPFPRPRRRS
jgi:hypothetical protein